MKKLLLMTLLAFPLAALSATYEIDTKGAHASIHFKIPHLGYSMLIGRFNLFSGEFTYDSKAPEGSTITVAVDTKSLDSNHAERDKHLKGDQFLDVGKYPSATFTSTGVKDLGGGKLQVAGDLTLHGVTKAITILASKVGEGSDPWDGYRAGFSGSTSLKLSDFAIPETLGPASTTVELELHIEGVRK